jgi:hypothetical protein
MYIHEHRKHLHQRMVAFFDPRILGDWDDSEEPALDAATKLLTPLTPVSSPLPETLPR